MVLCQNQGVEINGWKASCCQLSNLTYCLENWHQRRHHCHLSPSGFSYHPWEEKQRGEKSDCPFCDSFPCTKISLPFPLLHYHMEVMAGALKLQVRVSNSSIATHMWPSRFLDACQKWQLSNHPGQMVCQGWVNTANTVAPWRWQIFILESYSWVAIQPSPGNPRICYHFICYIWMCISSLMIGQGCVESTLIIYVL